MAVVGTKVHVPRPRARLVARDRLVERLDAAIGSGTRLVLVSASAGFGKTTLLTQWLDHLSAADGGSSGGPGTPAGPRVVWLSLDAGDADLHRFLTHLVAAVRSAVPPPDPQTGVEALDLLAAETGPATEDALVSLVNDLDGIDGRTVICLDDYHVVEAAPVHEALAFLLDNLPPQVTLAMTTRADPPLPLPRLRARGELVEVRTADLRFTEGEAGQFLNDVMALGLQERQVAALEARTEGWATGLQLAALSVTGRSADGGVAGDDAGDGVDRFVDEFTGSHRFVLDYLLDEVLDTQPDGIRTFLLDTCVLDELTAGLCDALTGRTDGQRTLETLERANLFVVPLDDERRWWRYHHLFADALRARLTADDQDRVRLLHRVAAQWYARDGRLVDAVPHAVAGDDMEQAADLVELVVPGLRRHREDRLLGDWLRAVPEEVARPRALLATHVAWLRLSEGDLGGVDAWLDAAEAALAAPAGAPAEVPSVVGGGGGGMPASVSAAVRDRGEDLAGLPAMIAVYRASAAQARGDLAGTAGFARQALDVAGPDDHFARGAAGGFLGLAAWAAGDLATAVDTFSEAVGELRAAGNATDVLGSAVVLAAMWTGRGRPDEARRLLERALESAAGRGTPVPVAGDLHVTLADVLREEGDLTGAEHHLDVAAELGDRGALPENRYRWFTVSARVRVARGDLDAAVAMLDEAEARVLPGFFPDVSPIPAQRARVRILQGRLADAREWVGERGVALAHEPTYLSEFDQLTLARLVLAEHRSGGGRQGDLDAVLRMLSAVITAAEGGERQGSVVEATFLRALALQTADDLDAAGADLARALALGVPVGYRRLFLDEGAPAEELLAAVDRQPRGEAVALAATVLHAKALEADAGRAASARSAGGPSGPTGTGTEGGASGTGGASGRGGTASGIGNGRAEALSVRELEVLRLLASDLSGPDIARHLFVSLNTLRTHTKHIFTKLDVTTRRAAVRRGTELGLL